MCTQAEIHRQNFISLLLLLAAAACLPAACPCTARGAHRPIWVLTERAMELGRGIEGTGVTPK